MSDVDDITKTYDEPHDRLTRMCAAMSGALDAHPEQVEGDPVRAVIMLDDAEHGGVVLHGYENEDDALVDILMHLKALLRARGKDLNILTVGQG